MRIFFTALHFLTRMKISKYYNYSNEDYQKSIVYFPLIGLLIGAILVIISYVGQTLFQPFTMAVIIIFSEVILTGGLHLDGFMDSCDALFSGRERERKLEIMKDSRVGAMGVIGISCLFLLKVSFLLEISQKMLFPVLFMMPMVGRWAVVYTITFYRYARQNGVGSMFHSSNKRIFIWSSLYTLIIFVFIIPMGPHYLSLLLVTISVIIISKRINNVLGGLTGDIYGMIIEITELLFLFGIILLEKI